MRPLAVPLVLALAAPLAGQTTVHTTITFEPGADGRAPVWDVRVEAEELEGDVRVQLEDWGEWSVVDALYVEWVSCAPPFAQDPPRGEVHALRDRERELSLHYRLHPTRIGSVAQERFALLPTWSPTYSFGFASNSVVELIVDGAPIEAQRTIELRAPEDLEIVSGFGEPSRGSQVTELDAPLGNALIAFGMPSARAEGEREGIRVEVVQFGAGHDATESVLDTILGIAPAIERTTRRAARHPVRVLITDNHGGGTATDHGLRVGYTADTPEWQRDSYYFHQHVAHEFFHEWLGIHLVPADDSLVWFFEGFTDYCALWHVAATGRVTRDWFAERIGELEREARTRSALGSVAFADPGVRWRDGDGPHEVMAYKGGAALAFALDAELFASEKGRVTDLVADLCARESRSYSRDDLRAWFEARGLTEFWTRHVAGKHLPALGVDLARVGFDVRAAPEPLTYLGARADGEGPGSTVLAVDPDGPAARAGMRAGDVITGFFPVRSGPRPTIAPTVDTEFRFGLATFEPGRDGAFVNVARGAAELALEITPRLIEGGSLELVSPAGEATDGFFRVPE
jgi:hypothetical protein